LAGPVEHDVQCVGWRLEKTNLLEKMGVVVYDPMLKPQWLSKAAQTDPANYLDIVNELVEPTELSKQDVFDAAYEMRDVDLRIVSVVDWAICYHPKKFTVGTLEEVLEMHRSGKPVFYCCPDGILSTWLLAAASNKYDYKRIFFKNWESLFAHIEKINNGEIQVEPYMWPGITWHWEKS